MDCKIDHTLDGAIPKALCVTCNPRPIREPIAYRFDAVAPATVLAGATGATGPDSHYDRKVKRKLKAEVKHWRERVEALERHTLAGATLTRARDILRKAETDLYMVL